MNFSNIDSWYSCGEFSEGYAWIAYWGDDGIIAQLVDQDGYVYYEGDYTGSPVVDGVCWIRYSLNNPASNHVSSDWEDDCSEMIINTQGQVLYRTSQIDGDNSSTREHILGYGNGKFIEIRSTIGINGEVYSIGSIDKNGNIVDEFWEAYDLSFGGEGYSVAEYLQDDYFRIGDYIYDLANQTVIYMGYDYDSKAPNTFDGYYYFPSSTESFTDAVGFTENYDDYPYWTPGSREELMEAGGMENLSENSLKVVRELTNFDVKILDFGSAKRRNLSKLSGITGTVYYCSPEIVNNKYDFECDEWACGVMMYILLVGAPPFEGETEEDIFSKILKDEVDLNKKELKLFRR